jgi:hypothetical protein
MSEPTQAEIRQGTQLAIVAFVFVIVMGGCMCSKVSRWLNDDSPAVDLSGQEWDDYYECTADMRDGGISLLVAAELCEVLKP